MWTIGNTWEEILKEEFDKEYFTKLKEYVNQEYAEKKIYPKEEEIFNALKLTDYDNVKCVILAQDPYPGTDKNNNRHGHGLAFSSLSQYEIPKSLQNIYKELETDIDNFKKPAHANLTKWATQGVLLLNSALTVRAGQANSHANIGWKQFTDTIIEKLGTNDKSIVFLLFGAFAQKSEKLITGTNKLILEGAHPSPLSAYRGFFGGKYFSKTNQFLIENNITPIDWQI